MAERRTGSTAERTQRIGETVGDLSEQVTALVQDELDRVRQELAGRARHAGEAGGHLALASVFGLAATGAALSLPVLVVRKLLPPFATAVVVGGLYGGAALVFARKALERLQEAAPAPVEEKIEEAKDDLASSLKERIPGSEPPSSVP